MILDDLAENPGRVAGLWYLLLAVFGAFSLNYIPTLVVSENAAATANNILGSETLFRFAIVAELISAIVTIFLVRALYRLFSGVNRTLASLMVTLVLVSVPIYFLNVLNLLAADTLLSGASFLSVFQKGQIDALVMLFVNLHSQGIAVVDIFSGLWLFPFGLLAYRSGFIPRILGAWLIPNGLSYLVISQVSLFWPSYANTVFLVTFPILLGEAAMTVWLLVKGVKVQSLPAPLLEQAVIARRPAEK